MKPNQPTQLSEPQAMNIKPYLRFYSAVCSSVVQDLTGNPHVKVILTLDKPTQRKNSSKHL
jgi:hypothetical protein